MINRLSRLSRLSGLAGATAAGSAVLCLLHPRVAWTAAAPDAALVWAATWLAWLVAAYLAAGVVAVAGTRLAGGDGPLARRVTAVTPDVIRRAVELALGAGVSASLVVATPAVSGAATPSPRPPATAPSAIPSSLAWPVAGPVSRPASATTAPRPAPPRAARSGAVVVRPGDTLWGIAARHLRRPTTARVVQAWPAWWTANRSVIGTDPDLIHPGEHLRAPAITPRRLP